MSLKYSVNRGSHWEVGFWLIFDHQGGVRLSRGEPNTLSRERAMQVVACVPHSIFSVPQLRARIDLAEQQTTPIEIDLAVAAEALSEAIGARVELVVKETQDA